jgi:hypothetical protein
MPQPAVRASWGISCYCPCHRFVRPRPTTKPWSYTTLPTVSRTVRAGFQRWPVHDRRRAETADQCGDRNDVEFIEAERPVLPPAGHLARRSTPTPDPLGCPGPQRDPDLWPANPVQARAVAGG